MEPDEGVEHQVEVYIRQTSISNTGELGNKYVDTESSSTRREVCHRKRR